MITLKATAASTAQIVERTVASLRASDRKTPANSGARSAGGRRAVVVAGMGGSLYFLIVAGSPGAAR